MENKNEAVEKETVVEESENVKGKNFFNKIKKPLIGAAVFAAGILAGTILEKKKTNKTNNDSDTISEDSIESKAIYEGSSEEIREN